MSLAVLTHCSVINCLVLLTANSLGIDFFLCFLLKTDNSSVSNDNPRLILAHLGVIINSFSGTSTQGNC